MVCKPRFLTFYSSIIVGLCCLSGFSTYIYHYAVSDSCTDSNSTISGGSNASLEVSTSLVQSSDDGYDYGEACDNMECTIAVLSTFGITFLAAVLGFEGSRKATSQKTVASCLFIFQFLLGGIALLALLGTVVLISFPQLTVCPGLFLGNPSDPVYLTILLSGVLSFLFMLASIVTGIRTKANLRSIEYKSGATY